MSATSSAATECFYQASVLLSRAGSVMLNASVGFFAPLRMTATPMPDIRPVIRDVLEKGYLLSLATTDEGGVWVADVIYVHDDDFNIYWMSDPEARHSKAVAGNPNVAGAIAVSGPGENNLGIQFSGRAEKIAGSRYDLIVKHFLKRKKLTLPKETDDVLQGDFWYVVRPTKIDLICEKEFGFDKQSIQV